MVNQYFLEEERLQWRGAEDNLKSGISGALTEATFRRAQAGDAEAITDLYNHYKPAIYRYLYHRSSSIQEAEELTTEVFIRVIENLPRYKGNGIPFQAWLFRVARNLVIDHYRRLNARQELEIHENIVGSTDDPEVLVERILDAERLREALKRLTPDQSDVIILRFLSGMPISEVAQVLNKSLGAVKMLQSRALESLYQMLKQEEV
ncbi:MAG: sigma-70 family RNA polymerase sigma factor [Saprospiraceae bacterium]|nr:sigma-70 family RNA polymerase sigma factor [Saprospiraceae bacterium]